MSELRLPQLDQKFLTDAGLETDIVFNHQIDLPHFASIVLLASDEGRSALDRYFRDFLELADRSRCGLILESATWRASPDWAGPLGLTNLELDDLNRAAIAMLLRLRDEYADKGNAIVVSGCIGPRGDGYDPGRIMGIEEATAYHCHQAGILRAAGADMLSAITMTNVPEAVGVALAAQSEKAPVAISFTLETDGRLPAGDSLAEAVAAVDQATGNYPAYFMINCAHPTHFSSVLDESAEWTRRVRGLRSNASRCSHAELDVMTELDSGDPAELATLHRHLSERLPWLHVHGGCCGTDVRHVRAIAEAVLPKQAK